MLSRKVITFILTIIIIVFLGGLSIMYFFEYKPLQEKISELKSSLKKEQEEIVKLDQIEEQHVNINTTVLQKKLPVSELVDQFILKLEEVEVASGTYITNVTFTDEIQAADNQDALAALQLENEEDKSKEESLPDGIKKLTAVITVESPTYLRLESFVKELENLERLTKVESLNYTGTKESDRFNPSTENLTFNITVATYYFPKLAELKSQLPKYEEPKPANKVNPLFEQDLTHLPEQKDETNTDVKMVKRNQVTYKVYTYQVKPGDTLFQLAILYYNSRSGEQLIKEWNNMRQLEAYTTIEIPVPTNGIN